MKRFLLLLVLIGLPLGADAQFCTGPGCNVSSGGTVTTVSVVTANGFSGTVANPTTTPAITIIPGAVPSTVGTSGSLTGPVGYFVCTGTCTVTPPVPVLGYQFCVMNDDNVATVITLAALGSGAMYENTARTAYGTAGTGTLASTGATGDMICIVGRDATHYLSTTFVGNWTAS